MIAADPDFEVTFVWDVTAEASVVKPAVGITTAINTLTVNTARTATIQHGAYWDGKNQVPVPSLNNGIWTYPNGEITIGSEITITGFETGWLNGVYTVVSIANPGATVLRRATVGTVDMTAHIGGLILFTVTFCANPANDLTCPPSYII